MPTNYLLENVNKHTKHKNNVIINYISDKNIKISELLTIFAIFTDRTGVDIPYTPSKDGTAYSIIIATDTHLTRYLTVC